MQPMSSDYTLTTNPYNGVQSWVFNGCTGGLRTRTGKADRDSGAVKASVALGFGEHRPKPAPLSPKKAKREKEFAALGPDAKKYASYVWAGGVIAGVIWFVACLLIILGVF